jgi:hypothetical protein
VGFEGCAPFIPNAKRSELREPDSFRIDNHPESMKPFRASAFYAYVLFAGRPMKYFLFAKVCN